MKGGEKWKDTKNNLQLFNRNWSGTSFLPQRIFWTILHLSKANSGFTKAFFFIYSYKNFGSGPVKYPLADMLQFVLEFATTKPASVSPATEEMRLSTASPTPPASFPHSEAVPRDSRYVSHHQRTSRSLTFFLFNKLSVIEFLNSKLNQTRITLVVLLFLVTQRRLMMVWLVVFPTANEHPSTSLLPNADPPLTAHHTLHLTASLRKSCTLLKPACSDGGQKWGAK